MRTKTKHYRDGILKATPIASCVANSTAVTLHTMSPGRTANLRKLSIFNGNGAPTRIQIGTGLAAAFVQAIPDIYCVNGQDLQITEEQIPAVEFTADITVRATTAAASPADVQVLAEVEEYAGITG